jgi:uncharacterized membrane-anchored protein
MTQQTRAEKELAITVVTLSFWGMVILFGVVAGLFLLDIIPSGNGVLIGLILLAVAGFNYVLMKKMVGKMEADLDESLE